MLPEIAERHASFGDPARGAIELDLVPVQRMEPLQRDESQRGRGERDGDGGPLALHRNCSTTSLMVRRTASALDSFGFQPSAVMRRVSSCTCGTSPRQPRGESPYSIAGVTLIASHVHSAISRTDV